MSSLTRAHLASVERSLLKCRWTTLDNEQHILQTHAVVGIAKQVVEGSFKRVLTNPLVQPLFAIDPQDIPVDTDYHFSLKFALNATLPPEEAEVLRIAVGVAALHAFVQANWTGPDLDMDPAAILKAHNPEINDIPELGLQAQAVHRLAYGGEPAYHIAKHPSFLLFALAIFELPHPTCVSGPWWRLRALNVHQRVLDEPTGLGDEVFKSLDGLRGQLHSEGRVDLEGQLILEIGLMHHIFGNDKTAAEHFVTAAKVMGLNYELTGALGKRTKFQIADHSQLIVLAESRRRDDEEEEKVHVETSASDPDHPPASSSLPENLPLNDDTLLEQTEFTSTLDHDSASTTALSNLNPSDQPALHPLDQSVLLGLCLNVKNTSPHHGLTKEQMSPYVARVLSHPRNWSIYTMALLLRSRLEADRTRTVERSTLQLQALIDQMPTSDSTVQERLAYIHAILLPSKWELEKELALRFLVLGVVRSALEIFERLEMWEHVVRCWQSMERPDKGLAIVRDLLEGQKIETELVTDLGKAREESRRPAMDVARTAKLWCLLGDLEPEKAEEHYQHAWEVSNHKSGRAMRSLGGYYFARNQYVEAVPCLKRATAITPLYHRTWFLLGCAQVRLERWEDARDAFGRCVAIDDDDAESWSNLATVYLRMGQAATAAADMGQANDDETLVEDNNLIPRNVPYANKMLAFRALKIAVNKSYDNWRMWSNYMLVAIDVGEMAEACRALARVVEERAAKEGDKCVDYEVLDRLVDAVIRGDDAIDGPNGNDSSEPQNDPNVGKRLAPRVKDLFNRTLLPRFSGSPRIFRSWAKVLIWQSAWGAALEAFMNAYRASVVNDEAVTTNQERFKEAVEETQELVDVMRNLGPKAAASDEESGDAAESSGTKKRGTSWQFQARSLVRTLMGRTKDTFSDEPDWQRLEETLEDLKN